MIIYKSTNKINGKSYIGQTTKNFKTRKYQHLNSNRTPFHRALKKENKNFKWEILCECNSIEELNEMEIYYQRLFNSIWPNGYNMIEGDSGITHKDTRKRLSKSMVGNNNGKKKYLIVTPERSNLIVENLKEYCKNIKIDYCKMTYVANGRRLHYKGYFCKKLDSIENINETIKELKNKKLKRNTAGYILTSPEGKEFKVNDLTNFCKKYPNINRYGFIRRLNSNNGKDYKGWFIKRIREEF